MQLADETYFRVFRPIHICIQGVKGVFGLVFDSYFAPQAASAFKHHQVSVVDLLSPFPQDILTLCSGISKHSKGLVKRGHRLIWPFLMPVPMRMAESCDLSEER
jgi:hypothetical protein